MCGGQRTQLYIFILWNLCALLSVAQNLPRFCERRPPRPPVCPRTRTPCSLDALSSVFTGLSLRPGSAHRPRPCGCVHCSSQWPHRESETTDKEGGSDSLCSPDDFLVVFWGYFMKHLVWNVCLPHTLNFLALCSNLYLSLIWIHILSDNNHTTAPFPSSTFLFIVL